MGRDALWTEKLALAKRISKIGVETKTKIRLVEDNARNEMQVARNFIACNLLDKIMQCWTHAYKLNNAFKNLVHFWVEDYLACN